MVPCAHTAPSMGRAGLGAGSSALGASPRHSPRARGPSLPGAKAISRTTAVGLPVGRRPSATWGPVPPPGVQLASRAHWGWELRAPGGGALSRPPGSQGATCRRGAHLVVHLLGAVEHVHHGAQGPAQVLRGLCLPGPGWAGRGPAHDQVEGLGQGYVAPARDPRSLRCRDPQPPAALSLWLP